MRTLFALSFVLASSTALAQGEALEDAAPVPEPPAETESGIEAAPESAPEAEPEAAPTPSLDEPAAPAAFEGLSEVSDNEPADVAPDGPGITAGDPGAAPPEDAPVAKDGEARTLCPPEMPCVETGDFAFWPSLRLRAGYEFVQPDADVLFVGQNDGFFLDQARVGFESSYRGRFSARLVLEMASVAPGAQLNVPVQPLIASARDAYLAWVPSEYFFISLGQQFMPFDYEGQVSRSELNFTSRSIATDGVRAGRGFEVEGLGPDRQVGVVLGARKAPLGFMNLDYRLAVTNGNGRNYRGNDNKLPAVFARLGAALGDFVGVGVAGQLNPRTTGDLPNLFTETHALLAADLRVDAFGIDFLAQGVYRRVSFDGAFLEPTDPNAADQGFGVTSWIVLDEPFGLPMFGFKPGYRFSFYEPSFSDPSDQLMENTISLRYDPPTPLRLAFIVEGTIMTEHAELDEALRDSPRRLDNNRVVALVQFEL